jgi:hypothetical protein
MHVETVNVGEARRLMSGKRTITAIWTHPVAIWATRDVASHPAPLAGQCEALRSKGS